MKNPTGLANLRFIVLFSIFCALPLHAQSTLKMTLLGNFGKGEGEPRAVSAAGSLVYYAVGTKIQIASFATPASPQKISSIELFETIRDIFQTTISSARHLVVVAGEKLFLINVQNPLSPSIVSITETGTTCQGVVTSGTFAYLAAGSRGLKIYNIAAPASPALVASVDSLQYCEGVFISSPYVYLAAAGRSHIVNISNQSSPTYVARVPVLAGGYHQGLGVRGQYAYLCDFNAGMQVVNISNPSSPSNTTFIATGAGPGRIVFDGNYGYVVNWEAGVKIIDISTPNAPTVVGTFDAPGRAHAVSFGAAGSPPAGHVFVADRNGGMRAINVSNAAAPTESGFIPIQAAASGSAFSVTCDNNRAYVAYGLSGLRIIDVSNPANPTQLGAFDTPGESRGVAVRGGFAYVADRSGGVRILDISNPSAPSEAGSVLLQNPRNIVLSGNYGFVADFDSGTTVIDVSNPASPQKVKPFPTSGYNAENISIGGNYVYVAKGAVTERCCCDKAIWPEPR